MRVVAVILLAAISAGTAQAASVDELFRQFGLYGIWSSDCGSAAAPSNPRVSITEPTPGVVLESHDLGTKFTVNKYSVLSAAQISPTELSVDVIFQPGSESEEHQKLIFRVRDGTRRTMFNQPAGGAPRVEDGMVVGRPIKTPLLRKCE